MSWLSRHRLKLYIRNTIWVFPAFSIVAGLIAVALLNAVDRAFGLELKLGPDTARTVMGTVAASMFTLVVVGSSAVLVAVQLGSAQLTPRIIAFIYRSRIRKFCISVFAFFFTFSVAALVRIESNVPLLTSYVAAYGFLINLALFLYFIDGIGKALRPSSAMQFVAIAGREVIQSVYPSKLRTDEPEVLKAIATLKDEPSRLITNEIDGVVLAFDRSGLMTMAEQANCLIELVAQVGDFVAAGDPLFRIFEGGENLSAERLRNSVAMGQERTLEQDPTYAFRIIVDIACKALSPAINDPTTAVLAIDQIHHLLRNVGSRSLASGRETDSRGVLRLVYRTPDWEDFVHLAVTEIRHYGDESIQIMRRLRAMLENLVQTLPERRAPMLRLELGLLQAAAKRMFEDLYDQSLAETGDLQGMGGGEYREPGVPAIA
jgi:uncharacterized membrane protein